MKQIDEQRYLWLFRVFCVLLILSVVANFTLLLTYFEVSPEPKREAFFVETQSEMPQEFYVQRIKVISGNIGQGIAEAYIRDYIINRESVFSDGHVMQKMWGNNGPVYYFSTKDVYNAFIRSLEYRDAIANRGRRVISASVEKINYQPASKEWIVDVVLKSTNPFGLEPMVAKRKLRITAEFMVGNEKLNNKNKWVNPLGFKITSYQYIQT